MAKKNLINADMLLATPRRTVEPVQIADGASSVATIQASAIIPEIAPVVVPVVVPEPPSIAAAPEPEVVEEPETPMSVASVKRGLKGNETRATFIVDETLLEKLKAIAYWERLNIKEVINETFQNYIDNYEKQNNPVRPIPKK
jgi:hypothetical protein